MIRSILKKQIERYLIGPSARFLAHLRVGPNATTIAGLLVSLGAAFLLALGYFTAGGALILVGGVFDLLDGALARLRSHSSSFGAFLDSTADRISEGAICFGFLFYYVDQQNQIGALLAYLAVLFATLVSYLRARGEGLGISTSKGLVTRPERVVLLAVGALVDQAVVFLGIIVVLSIFTAVQRFVHIGRSVRAG